MNNQIFFITKLVSIILISCMSAYSHELYNKIPCFFTSLFFPINESPWEHTKLFYIPPIIGYFLEYCIIGQKYGNFFVTHVLSIVLMPFLMLLIYYLYLGLGFKNNVVFNIILTIFTIIIGSLSSYVLTMSSIDYTKFNILAIIVLISLVIAYALLSYVQPHTHLFYDKFSKRYGIAEHTH